VIDLRSDFCAPPTEEMWAAMRSGGERSVTELERRGAELLGKQAALLCPTCSAANLVAVLALTRPGQRAAIDERAHIVVNEGGWLTDVAGLEAVPLGDAADVVCLENTHTRRGGAVLTVEETSALAATAPRSHLDGARLPNAAVALGVPIAELAAPVDTVALSLNKGLCAPYGALLAGDEDVLAEAHRRLAQLGGGTVHKQGFLAAAGLVALGLVDRLADDHARARRLAELLGLPAPATNIVITELPASALPDLERRGVLAFAPGGGNVRLVTHRGISDDEVERAASVVGDAQHDLPALAPLGDAPEGGAGLGQREHRVDLGP
jgi:threonine aldolase